MISVILFVFSIYDFSLCTDRIICENNKCCKIVTPSNHNHKTNKISFNIFFRPNIIGTVKYI